MSRSPRLAAAPLALAALPLLATACTTYAQNRAALVPRATPLAPTGQPLPAAGELELGASNLADLAAPTAGDPAAGIEVPSTQLRGAAMLRLGPDAQLGAVYERGLARTGTALQPSQPPVDGGDVAGYGASFAYAVPLDPQWRLALATELVFWNVPWIEYTTCVDSCATPGATEVSRGSDVVPTIALGVSPSYHTGRFTFFGGVTARNQPTLRQKLQTSVPSPDADVQEGPMNALVHAGVEVALGSGVRASLVVHDDLTRDPVAYGPAIGVQLSLPLGTLEPPR